MEGLLSFLLIGIFFFLMMRYGCGAHMAHGGHGEHGNPGAGNEQKHADPVCGMDVDSNQGYGKMHNGQLYRFCSRNCLDKFEAAPDKYLKQPVESTGGGS
jgi:YHS domain-containing protein